MTDRWMNIGHENDELKPHIEPKPDLKDVRRLGKYLKYFLCAKYFKGSIIFL